MTIKNNQLEDSPRKTTKVSEDPAVGVDQGAFFPKEVSSVVEGFYVDSHGRTIQITDNGNLKIPPSLVGEANTTSNAGSLGEGLALPKNGVDLPFKRLKAGQNITLNPQETYVEIIANFPPSQGEANTASNIGLSGQGLFKQKSGVNLEFKRLKAGNNVIITATNNDEIEISAATSGSGGGSGEANTASNLGSITNGLGLFSTKNGVDLQFKRIKAGSNITLTDEGNDILITATGGGSGSGDMLKTTYDTNNDGVVDNATQLNSQSAAYYLARSNHTGTQAASTITGLASVATVGTLGSLTNVNASSPTIGQVLQWSGTAWINATLGGGSGDMMRSVYDTDNNGIVDNSEKLNNQAASYYLSRTNHTGTQSVSTITGLATVATSGSYNDLSNKPSIPNALSSLTTDVLISTPTSGQVLQWNGTKWANTTLAAGSGDMLKSAYDTTNSGNAVDNSRALNSQNAAYYLSRANHTGTQSVSTITGLAAVATTGAYSSLSGTPTIPTALSALTTDVLISGVTTGQFLQYNGTKWANVTVSLSGEANTASNIGTGTGLFAQKSSVDLQFKTLKAGTNVTISSTTNEVTINASVSGGGGGIYRYSASNTSGEEAWVLATDVGVTYSRTGTVGTFVIPVGVQLISARLRLPMATIGGTSFTVVYGSGSGNGAGDNTSAADAYRPNLSAWREDTSAAVPITSSISSGFDRITVNTLASAQTNSLKLVW